MQEVDITATTVPELDRSFSFYYIKGVDGNRSEV